MTDTPNDVAARVAQLADRMHPGFAVEYAAEQAARAAELDARRAALAAKREAAEADSAARRRAPSAKARRHYGSGVGAVMREAVAGAREASAAERRRRRRRASPTKPRSSERVRARGAQKVFLEARRRDLAEMRGVPVHEVPELPPIDWRIRGECLSIARDSSGRRALRFALQLPPRVRRMLGQLVTSAGGWANRSARRLCACAWATWRLSRGVRRSVRVVDGFARRVWCLLVVDADGHCPALSTLWGTHVGRTAAPAPMTVLRRAGLWTRVQPPAGDARYVGFSGWAVGQMWFASSTLCPPSTDAEAEALGADFDALLSALDPPS